MFSKNKKKKNDSSSPIAVIPAVTVSVFFGLIAGIVGMLLMLAYSPVLIPQFYVYSQGLMDPLVSRQGEQDNREFLTRDVTVSSALLYLTHHVGEVTLPVNAIGSATVLTSDGWVMTHEDTFAEYGNPNVLDFMAIIDGREYQVTEAVTDDYTGVTFLKVDGAGLPVAEIGQNDGLGAGDAVYSFGLGYGLKKAAITEYDVLPASSLKDAVRSSERIQKFIRLTDAEGYVIGSAIFNRYGEVVGIFAGDGESESYAVPIDSIYPYLGDLLRDGGINRPYLGVNFIDLSEHPTSDGLDYGVRLRGYGNRPAVVRGGPAAVAGLRAGDILLSVNGERITANKSLPELLVDYEVGQKINLDVLRSGEEVEISVELSE